MIPALQEPLGEVLGTLWSGFLQQLLVHIKSLSELGQVPVVLCVEIGPLLEVLLGCLPCGLLRVGALQGRLLARELDFEVQSVGVHSIQTAQQFLREVVRARRGVGMDDDRQNACNLCNLVQVTIVALVQPLHGLKLLRRRRNHGCHCRRCFIVLGAFPFLFPGLLELLLHLRLRHSLRLRLRLGLRSGGLFRFRGHRGGRR
mmetsp:Transcript_58026/g.147223  ORF Transcript_58026/g.147223 Transcript_58026/m.147223 type:complete len:202 (-) Transcript_58026:53-658(-)